MEFESAGSKWQKTWGQFQGKLHFFFEFTEFKVALQGSTVQCIFQAHAKSVLCKFMSVVDIDFVTNLKLSEFIR